MSRVKRVARWARVGVCLAGFLAAAMVPSDGRALAPGGVVIWFDDITNTLRGTSDVCISVSNDFNGDLAGNGSNVDNGKDKNGDGTGNAGKGGGKSFCF